MHCILPAAQKKREETKCGEEEEEGVQQANSRERAWLICVPATDNTQKRPPIVCEKGRQPAR